jgi:hypothetical protein
MAYGLSADYSYEINFEFDADENEDEFENEECEGFNMQIKSFSTAEKCLHNTTLV